jgi:hypothetical protein
VAIFSGGEFGAVCRLMLAVPLSPGAGPQDIQVRLWPAGAQTDGPRLIKPMARPATTAFYQTAPACEGAAARILPVGAAAGRGLRGCGPAALGAAAHGPRHGAGRAARHGRAGHRRPGQPHLPASSQGASPANWSCCCISLGFYGRQASCRQHLLYPGPDRPTPKGASQTTDMRCSLHR